MEQTTSRILAETISRRLLEGIKKDPERSARNLIDMGLQAAPEGHPKQFFSDLREMLERPDSAYYGFVRSTVAHIDTERLLTFGLNAGYNSFVVGSKRLRAGCTNEDHTPWYDRIDLATVPPMLSNATVANGESKGIYLWILSGEGQTQEAAELAAAHPDSAFCIFCRPDDVDLCYVDSAAHTPNLMTVVFWDEDAHDACARLREEQLLFSVCCVYDSGNAVGILSGETILDIQELHPFFTVLSPAQDCPQEVRREVYAMVCEARARGAYQTMLWELEQDGRRIEELILEAPAPGAAEGAEAAGAPRTAEAHPAV